jgi:hypothetical protein
MNSSILSRTQDTVTALEVVRQPQLLNTFRMYLPVTLRGGVGSLAKHERSLK